MTNFLMAGQTGEFLTGSVHMNLAGGCLMAADAAFRGDALIHGPDPNRLMKIIERKRDTVVEAVDSLDHPLIGKRVGCMAVVAPSNRLVA